jgi:hypothetical protein
MGINKLKPKGYLVLSPDSYPPIIDFIKPIEFE